MKGVVQAICSSTQRQEPKAPLSQGVFEKDRGLVGDSHYDMKERQVSLLRREDIQEAEKEAGFPFPFGSLAENLVIRDLPEELPVGTLLTFSGGVVLRVVEKGKRPGEPHSYDYKGWCLLPVKGYFLEVLEGGTMLSGEELEVTIPQCIISAHIMISAEIQELELVCPRQRHSGRRVQQSKGAVRHFRSRGDI